MWLIPIFSGACPHRKGLKAWVPGPVQDRHGGRNVNSQENTARALAASSLAESNRIGYGYAVDHCSIDQLRSKWSLLRGLPRLPKLQSAKSFISGLYFYTHGQWKSFSTAHIRICSSYVLVILHGEKRMTGLSLLLVSTARLDVSFPTDFARGPSQPRTGLL